MSRNTALPILVLILVILSSAFVFENKLLPGAIILYCACFFAAFAFALKRAHEMHIAAKKTALTKAQSEAGVWLAPMSRKVQWAEENCKNEKLLGFWQGESVFENWLCDNEKWVWHRNTVKDIWPKDEPLADGVKWWKGVAIYKRAEKNDDELVAEINAV